MKISIDLDGTLYAHREFFRVLMELFQSVGHCVGILTGHSAESEVQDRAKLLAIGCKPDFYLGRTERYTALNGAVFKREMIIEHNIDLHFDDNDYGNPVSIRLISELEFVRRRIVTLPKDNNKATEHGW